MDRRMTLEDMKAELEANGYELGTDLNGCTEIEYIDGDVSMTFNEAVEIMPLEHNHDVLVRKAYTHLQEKRKTTALEQFVLNCANSITDEEYGLVSGSLFAYAILAKDLVVEYNITADESDDDE